MSAKRNRIGVIAPFDMALDAEYWQLVPDDVSVHFTRLPIVDLPYGPEHARSVADAVGLEAAARSLVRIGPEVVAFACTSASFVDGVAGEARIRRAIEAVGVPHATTPSGALVEALTHAGVTRVAIGTPYEEALGEHLMAFLREAGLKPGSLVTLGLSEEEEVIAATPGTVDELAERAMFTGAQAVFLACTNLPTVGLLPDLGRRLGVPVMSANSVLMWASLRRLSAGRSGPAPRDGGSPR
ncbi:aspartate/glutamate racemase family protein [soil metagenome]